MLALTLGAECDEGLLLFERVRVLEGALEASEPSIGESGMRVLAGLAAGRLASLSESVPGLRAVLLGFIVTFSVGRAELWWVISCGGLDDLRKERERESGRKPRD